MEQVIAVNKQMHDKITLRVPRHRLRAIKRGA
jgi:hypothetical protein